MKTAISIPDDLFAAADELARELGISRSELYATAVTEFLAKHDAAEVTARLNSLYAAEPSGLSPELRRMQRRSVGRERGGKRSG
jgi:metal-responsive CopG/Arc/MetJ family transcriptional regulator